MSGPVPVLGSFLRAAWFLSIAAMPLLAQESVEPQPRAPPHLDAPVQAQVDSARASGLPTNPLVQKALEGAARNASDSLVLAAVRGLRLRMERAAKVLEALDEDEFVAAADALFAGISDDGLRALAVAVPDGGLVTWLTVFTDLVRRGVTAEASASTVRDLANAGVGGEELSRVRRSILTDIANGVDPAMAARDRARAYVRRQPPQASATRWRATGPFSPASGRRLGLGFTASSSFGTRGVASVGARGWMDASGPGAAQVQGVRAAEVATWGSGERLGWYGHYRRHAEGGDGQELSQAALGVSGTSRQLLFRAMGTALRARGDDGRLKGGALSASLGRNVGALGVELLMRAGTSLEQSAVGRDTVFEVGPYAFRSDRVRLIERSRNFGDLGLLVEARQGPVSALVSLGHRVSPRRSERGPWLDAAGVLAVGRQASVEVRGGWARPYPWGTRAGGAWIQAGIDVRLWGADLGGDVPRPPVERADRSVLDCSKGGAVWSIDDRGEARVEWMGDPSDWRPEAMGRGDGRWTSLRAFPEGRHRLLIRIDGGGWTPPPDLPIVLDELGPSGLLVVKGCPAVGGSSG